MYKMQTVLHVSNVIVQQAPTWVHSALYFADCTTVLHFPDKQPDLTPFSTMGANNESCLGL